MLLWLDQARAGEGLGFCTFSDQIQAADAATHPRPTHPQLGASKSQRRWPSSRLAPDSGPLAFECAAQLMLSYPVSGHCSLESTSLAQLPPQPFLLTPPALGVPLPPSSTPLPCSLSFSASFSFLLAPTSSSQPFRPPDHTQSCRRLPWLPLLAGATPMAGREPPEVQSGEGAILREATRWCQHPRSAPDCHWQSGDPG